jgi:hypothetical protein
MCWLGWHVFATPAEPFDPSADVNYARWILVAHTFHFHVYSSSRDKTQNVNL